MNMETNLHRIFQTKGTAGGVIHLAVEENDAPSDGSVVRFLDNKEISHEL